MDVLDDIIARFAPDTLLGALEPSQLQDLLRNASRRELKPGEAIITQGDEDGDFAVFLLSGGLKISMVSAGGREIILNYCGPGEVVGEIAMLDSGARTATVTAVERSSVLLLPSRTFIAAATANPASLIGRLRYNPSQSDLGAFAGLARENVSGLLSEWETRGIVGRTGRALVIRDPDYLRMLAEFGDDA